MRMSHKYFLSDKSCLGNGDASPSEEWDSMLGFKTTSHFLYLIANCTSLAAVWSLCLS